MNKKIALAILFCALTVLPSALWSQEVPIGGAMDISDRAYYQKLRELFLLARKTIDLSVESITVTDLPGDPVSVLIEDLIVAQKRGVRIRLFLNTFAPSGTQGSLFLHDDILWTMRRAGIEIHFVNPTYHLKDHLVILDGKQVLEGGLRWRKEDLENSLGSATLLESEPLADQKRLRLEFLPLWDVEQKRLEQTEGNVAVPLYLIRELRYFPKMVLHDDGDAMKIYLSLLRLFYQVQDVHLNAVYEDLSHDIPADEFYERTAAAFQVVKTIERLETEYGLIQIEDKASDRARIRMVFPSQNDAMIKVPIFFFQEGFSKSLTPPALFAYFVIHYKTQISGEAPVWLGSERNVEQDFPLSEEKFRAGVSELRERNLVEVFPFQLQKSYRKLSSLEYRYLLNPVPTMSQRLQSWDRLREEFGDDSVRRAQDLAKILGEPEDPKVIAVYLDLLKNFKAEDVMAFTERLSALPPDSTPAQMDYLRTLLEHESKNTSLATV